jgi:DNA-directed RNA polymerase beta' subunit
VLGTLLFAFSKNKKTTMSQKRFFWGQKYDNLPKLDLIALQKESYGWFLNEGIKQGLLEISPIEDYTGKRFSLEFEDHSFDPPRCLSREALKKRITYDSPLKVNSRLTNKKTGEVVKQEVFLGNIPQMTETGTFIISGVERAVVNQLIRSPGVFFSGEVDTATGRMFYKVEIRPLYGSWIEFNIDRYNVIWTRINRRRKFPVSVLLRAIGLATDEEIIKTFTAYEVDKKYKFIANTIEKDATKTKEEALLEVYQKIRPGGPAILSNARELLQSSFFDSRRYNLGKVGRYKINKKLNLKIENKPENWVLTKDDIIQTIAYLIKLQNGEGRVDDIDHLGNRRVRRVGELVYQTAFRIGLLRLERAIKGKMSLARAKTPITPASLVNARPLVALIDEFFKRNRLSTILDQTNPLSELDNLRRLSVMGPGGITRERASFSMRDISVSQYGRICPVRSPEGPNIGLVTYLALFSKINEYGFLETPYRKVKKVKRNGKTRMKVADEIVYLAADDEEKYYITHTSINIDQYGYLEDSWVPVRCQGRFLEAPVEKVQYIDLTPRQVFGVSASLIPFLSHDEANRALMGTNMQCQAVPLLKPESPIVGTGMEKAVVEVMGRSVRAKEPGKVVYVDANKIVVKNGQKKKEYTLEKFSRSSQGTCYSQRPVVSVGQKVKKGDLLIDGPAAENGELALGKNLLIAYTSFEGLGYEDAIVVSDRLVREDLLTSIQIKTYEADVMETKLGPEELTRDIPNVSEESLRNLDSEGVITVGSEVKANDILVGKIAPKGEKELTAEERLLRAIFGEKAREVRDTSLRVSHGDYGTVIGINVLDREKGDELDPGARKKIIVEVAQMRKIKVGDKLAGRHGNKGVISKIVPQADMPYLEDGTPVDIIISPLSVLARMNLGQLLEAHLGWAANKLGYRIAVPVFEKTSEEKISQELKKASLPDDGKVVLYDGRTGEPFEKKVAVGIAYINKLIHMVEDKAYARSTGPYSLVTQQPLGGKAQMGGQRLGEMEVWALEAHRAAHTLQEMLTIKSDDVVGRAKAFAAIVKGTDIAQPSVPASFKVLVKELRSLGLNVIPKDNVKKDGLKKKMKNIVDFNRLKIKLASPEEIISWSHGEILRPETINYRTLRPEKDGLFCEKIFGPSHDWECYCGKYKGVRHRGIVCDRCGVEVTRSQVRRERMGHIELASPVAHVWFFKGTPSALSLLLDIPNHELTGVIYFSRYLILDVDRKQRKEAVLKLEAALKKKTKELKDNFEGDLKEIKKKGEKRVSSVKERIKGTEQKELAVEEAELNTRREIASLRENYSSEESIVKDFYKTLREKVEGINRGSLLSEDEYWELNEQKITSFFKAEMGAEAILKYIKNLELNQLAKELKKEIKERKGQTKIRARKRLRVIEGMKSSSVDPSWMILKVLPVIPPDLRPMVQLSGGRFATSDLNDLYRRVINRNNRLKYLIRLGAPDIILRNEKRMLQEAVDALIDSSKVRKKRYRGVKELRSLSDMLKGKKGRFRKNLLGKRVDYSGRSVIVVGPELSLNQCGLPKEMALEMFKPYLLRELISRGLAPNVRSAKNIVDHRSPEVFDILEEITRDHPVLLNRAPTLHKLGIQAFYPILVEGEAIRIHPCVCSGFNADFDGDQMAVHVPLSKSAIGETEKLMLPGYNLLKPADGSPISVPNKEMALGIYHLTSIEANPEKKERVFVSLNEAVWAYQSGGIGLREGIQVKRDKEVIKTSVGRILFNEVLPKTLGFMNEAVSAGKIKDLVKRGLRVCSKKEIKELIDNLKDLGFETATTSGLSVAVSDCRMSREKEEIIKKTNKKVEKIEEDLKRGLITEGEKPRLFNNAWMEATEEIADKTWEEFEEENPVKIIVNSGGTRASRDQIKQLSAMRGLVVDPLGNIVELPTKSNFREGLSIFEYVTSSRGSRKGLTDSALKTADAGYLTRRLIDVAHDVIVRENDCGTKEGVEVPALQSLGRVVAKRLIDPGSKKVLAKRGEVVDEEKLNLILKKKISSVLVRSSLTCETKHGVCVQCYGWNFSTKEMVEIGTPVGILAAQSIGEPGTQLTLRVKHAGGIVGLDVTQGLPRVEELFEARTPKIISPIAEINGKVKITETEEGYKVQVKTVGLKPVEEREYLVPLTSHLRVKSGDLVAAGEQLASGGLDINEVLGIRGLKGVQTYLIQEIQKVYQSQGIPIDDKHFEVIIKKMSEKVQISLPGETSFLPGELVNQLTFEEENGKIGKNGKPAKARKVILGITRASLQTDSWLSAASFQETTNVLARAAIEGVEDRLLGLKENVIIGRLIPTSPERVKIGAHN